jgi:hypothetical protein
VEPISLATHPRVPGDRAGAVAPGVERPADPRAGDVVIRGWANGSGPWVIHASGLVPQLAYSTRGEAETAAHAYASAAKVDVWYDGDGGARLLAAYRPRRTADVRRA